MSKSLMRVSAAILIAILAFVGLFILERRHGVILGSEPVTGPFDSWLVPLLITVATIAGVLARSIYEVVTTPPAPTTYRATFIAALAPSKTLLALVIAPVLIALFYKTIRSSEDVFFILLTSFQNGFFWKTLLKT
ncbi:hypothetical protein [Rhizobium ruizarguesonis]|uniref:hypothetical protein n=1 Tax=Rhizobium ruizarguesonis TaxID=2081791 RepID=UPI0010320F99|nr:hypothetical protein [Rhizobium ruizarguesonis]TAZ23411.1 hypothetical protein ELH74_37795 [Rhizobium ruizarguesonis]TBD07718.1 hypothetical protein ELH23_39075 [Rhizobium ruizarguesonis]